MKKILFAMLLIQILFVSCIENFNANLTYNEQDILVVDGNIVENSELDFYLSKSFPINEDNRPADIAVEAELYIIDSNGSKSSPATYLGDGIHRIVAGMLDSETAYGLEIIYNGETYRSELTRPIQTPEIENLSWAQPERNGDIEFFISTDDLQEDGISYFLWNYDEVWEFTALIDNKIRYNPATNYFEESRPNPLYYCWKYHYGAGEILVGSTESLSENRIINQFTHKKSSQDKRFTIMYCVEMKQRKITRNAYDYYRNKAKINQEMGGLFTPQPSELIGNIQCITKPELKTIGYISVNKNIAEKRLFIVGSEITQLLPEDPSCGQIKPEATDLTPYELYRNGYRPVGERVMGSTAINVEYWTPAYCVDCTESGGSKIRPDYWPTQHE